MLDRIYSQCEKSQKRIFYVIKLSVRKYWQRSVCLGNPNMARNLIFKMQCLNQENYFFLQSIGLQR